MTSGGMAGSMAAPVPEQSTVRALVLKPHRAGDGSQLELAVNDIVCVLEKDASGWWGGHKEGEEQTGWFPGSCVREIIEKDVIPTASPLPAAELSDRTGADSQAGDEKGKDGDRQRRLSPVWKRITRESSPGFSHTVDIEFSRKSDDRFQSIQLIRPSSPASSIASGHQSMPTGLDANREIKRLRDLVAELRHVKRLCETEVRQLRNNVSNQETEVAAKRAESAQLEQKLRHAAQREELLTKEVETLRQELQQEKQTSKQLKQELDNRNTELKVLIQSNEDPSLRNLLGDKPGGAWVGDFAEKLAVDSSTMQGSAEALRRRLFPHSRPDGLGTGPGCSVSSRADDLESLASAVQSISSAAQVAPGMGKSEQSSPVMRQSEPRQVPASSTASTMDETMSQSSISTATGLSGQRMIAGDGSITVPGVPRPIKGSMNLPMPTREPGDGTSPAVLKSMTGSPGMPGGATRTVYMPSTGALAAGERSPSALSRNSINGLRTGAAPKMSTEGSRKPILPASGYGSPSASTRPRV